MQIQPKLSSRPEEMAKAKRSLCRDGTLTSQDLCNAVSWDVDLPRELRRTHVKQAHVIELGFMNAGCGALLCLIVCLPACSQEHATPVSVCQLEEDPATYNHTLVEVTAFVSHGFENFGLFDLPCRSEHTIWLEYGGKVTSGTVYCCGQSAKRQRPRQLKVEGIDIPLLDNQQFRTLDKLIQPPFRSGSYGAVVHTTLVGRFFSGQKTAWPGGTFWGGYGHMGCCSLLAIQQVKSVDTETRDDLDDGQSYDQPDIKKSGCGFQSLMPLSPQGSIVSVQKDAERAREAWVFDDPGRVAIKSLSRFTGASEQSINSLKETRKSGGRFVYEWTPASKKESYMVVVSRPYTLSFYAANPKRVAWVVTAAYMSSCGNATP